MSVGTHAIAFLVGVLLGLLIKVGRDQQQNELENLLKQRSKKP